MWCHCGLLVHHGMWCEPLLTACSARLSVSHDQPDVQWMLLFTGTLCSACPLLLEYATSPWTNLLVIDGFECNQLYIGGGRPMSVIQYNKLY